MNDLTATMLVHITFGAIAITTGFIAVLVKKGCSLHRIAGRLFVFSMMVMALSGTYVAFQKPEMITVLAGLFTAYLVLSALVSIRSTSALSSWQGVLLAFYSACIGAAGLYYGYLANLSANKLYDGFPVGSYVFFGSLAIFCSFFDITIFLNKGIENIKRIRRHAWRMCVALLIATTSFFDGPGAVVFPSIFQGSVILLLPQLTVFGLMIYWLIRISYFKKTS